MKEGEIGYHVFQKLGKKNVKKREKKCIRRHYVKHRSIGSIFATKTCVYRDELTLCKISAPFLVDQSQRCALTQMKTHFSTSMCVDQCLIVSSSELLHRVHEGIFCSLQEKKKFLIRRKNFQPRNSQSISCKVRARSVFRFFFLQLEAVLSKTLTIAWVIHTKQKNQNNNHNFPMSSRNQKKKIKEMRNHAVVVSNTEGLAGLLSLNVQEHFWKLIFSRWRFFHFLFSEIVRSSETVLSTFCYANCYNQNGTDQELSQMSRQCISVCNVFFYNVMTMLDKLNWIWMCYGLF